MERYSEWSGGVGQSKPSWSHERVEILVVLVFCFRLLECFLEELGKLFLELPRRPIDGHVALGLLADDVRPELPLDLVQFPWLPGFHVQQFGVTPSDSLISILASIMKSVEKQV